MIRDDLKLPGDDGEISKSQEFGGSNPDCEISSLHDEKLARCSIASCALALVYWPSVSKKNHMMTIFTHITCC
jgi:hypothetical protein